MKNIKNIVAILASIVLLVPPAVADNLYGTLAKIDEANEIVIGHREASIPFASLDDNQKAVGYSIDLCLRVVESVNERLGKKVAVRYVPVNGKTRIPLLANGTIDIECGSTTNNLTRQKQVDYAHVTFITGTKLLVKKSSGIREVEDLDGKVISLTQGTTNERVIKALIKEKGLDVKIVSVKDHNFGFLALESDRVDAHSTDHILLFGLISKAKNPDDYIVTGRFLSYDPYALMVRRDDSEFRLLVNKTLSEIFRSGEINGIYDKWFLPLGVPATDLLKAAFEIQALPN